MMRLLHPRTAVALVAATLVIGACGGDTDSPEVPTLDDATATEGPASSSPRTTAEEAALLFAQCMRDNGIDDFVDPGVDDKGGVEFAPGSKDSVDQDRFKTAYEACEYLLQGTVKGEDGDDADADDALYELAVCMRANGFDMPDPDPTGNAYANLDKEAPEFVVAFEECADVFTSSKSGNGDDSGK